MADLPDNAMPGEVHRGPDNRWYMLEWSGNWLLTPRDPEDEHDPELGPPGPEPEPLPEPERSLPAHVIAAGQRIAVREQAEAMAASAERRRILTRETEAEAARQRLAAQTFDPAADDQQVEFYEEDHADVIAEVPPGTRRDGWTVERRLLFLDRLAEHGNITSACRAVGCSRQSVVKLRPRAPAFAAAMDRATRASAAILADTLFDRALHGHEVPILHEGEVVATRTVHHDALGIYLLKVRDPLNYAPIDELERWKKHRAIDADAKPAVPASPTPTTSTTSTT